MNSSHNIESLKKCVAAKWFSLLAPCFVVRRTFFTLSTRVKEVFEPPDLNKFSITLTGGPCNLFAVE